MNDLDYPQDLLMMNGSDYWRLSTRFIDDKMIQIIHKIK
jgi:hypothetical protein